MNLSKVDFLLLLGLWFYAIHGCYAQRHMMSPVILWFCVIIDTLLIVAIGLHYNYIERKTDAVL